MLGILIFQLANQVDCKIMVKIIIFFEQLTYRNLFSKTLQEGRVILERALVTESEGIEEIGD